MKANDASVLSTRRVGLQAVSRALIPVDHVRIKYVELVALHHLRRRIVVVVVRLVILVPLVAGVYTIEVLRLARTILIVPPSHFLLQRHLERELRFTLLHALVRLLVEQLASSRAFHGLHCVHSSRLDAIANRLKLTRIFCSIDRCSQVLADLSRSEQHWAVPSRRVVNGGAASRRTGRAVHSHLHTQLLVIHLLLREELWRVAPRGCVAASRGALRGERLDLLDRLRLGALRCLAANEREALLHHLLVRLPHNGLRHSELQLTQHVLPVVGVHIVAAFAQLRHHLLLQLVQLLQVFALKHSTHIRIDFGVEGPARRLGAYFTQCILRQPKHRVPKASVQLVQS
mmetsp:Transcript_5526/g.11454  ORF Transcript_5526/g.11454 Transcript_5526/m.11454 type:complete len:344 (+) Transcript_5526:387-1418(+)